MFYVYRHYQPLESFTTNNVNCLTMSKRYLKRLIRSSKNKSERMHHINVKYLQTLISVQVWLIARKGQDLISVAEHLWVSPVSGAEDKFI